MSMLNSSNQLIQATRLIKEADYILVGAGAGLSAAGGLNYSDPELFKKWFPILASVGINTIAEAISLYWYMKDSNIRSFWGYWANHINKIRYEAPILKPYLQLYELLKNKNYFIITTNVDGQFIKAGFDQAKIFAPQGDYALFQCEHTCSDEVYPNKVYIDKMISGMDMDTFAICEEDIPHCPKCGAYMSKNLRIDNTFIEVPHLQTQDSYFEFINNSVNGKLVLLELGVGFNTPVIIRWPFEKITLKYPNATLLRINMNNPDVPKELITKSISFSNNITDVITEIIADKI